MKFRSDMVSRIQSVSHLKRKKIYSHYVFLAEVFVTDN